MTTMKRDLKAEMLVAAERLLREQGLGGLTTRALAEAVPCSEGAIYVHFEDRLDLVLAVLQTSLPEMLEPLRGLEERVGQGTPAKNLEAALRGLQRFHARVTPMLCSLFMERELLLRFRKSLRVDAKGPDRGVATLARYIAKEQNGGRVASEVDAKTAAAALMAGSFFHCFTQQLLGTERPMEVKRVVAMALRA